MSKSIMHDSSKTYDPENWECVVTFYPSHMYVSDQILFVKQVPVYRWFTVYLLLIDTFH